MYVAHTHARARTRTLVVLVSRLDPFERGVLQANKRQLNQMFSIRTYCASTSLQRYVRAFDK